MRNSKLGLKALGLAVLGALSLTAFFAAGAQGQEALSPSAASGLANPGKFTFNSGGIVVLLALLEGTQEAAANLQVPTKGLRIECATGLTKEAEINVVTDAAAASVLFSECLVLNLKKEHIADCTILTPGEPTGSVATNPLLGLPILHGTGNYVAVEPQVVGGDLALIELHGKECPLPLQNPLKGYVVGQMTTNDNVEPLLTFSQAISELVGKSRLLFGAAPAFLNGSFKGKLAGKGHAGLKLGVV